MAVGTNSFKVGNLINNANPEPDGTVATSTSQVEIAASGTTQADAAAISAQHVLITNNTAANGVILPVGLKGQTITILPLLVTNAPKVYPPLGGTVAFGAVNANTTATARAKTTFWCRDDTGLNWV